jgi:hypothetical protein
MGFENGKLVRVSLVAQAGEKLQVNTFHYDLIDAIGQTPNDPQSLADLFVSAVRPHFAALYTGGWSILPVVVLQEKDPQNPNAGRQEWSSGLPIPGTRTGSGADALPLAMCATATIHTEHVGRRHRGRLFLGGSVTESDQASGIWDDTSGILSLWQALLNAIPMQPDLSAEIGGDVVAHWCVYSRTQRGADFDPYASKVIGTTLHTKVHWLRSRDD